MKRKLISMMMITVLSVGMLAGCGQSEKKPEKTAEAVQEEAAEEESAEQEDTKTAGDEAGSENLLSGKHQVEMVIEDYGTIQMELDADKAPISVTNFVNLAEDGFYDGLTFHRIMDGFMMQGGDPNGNGSGGSEETIKGEFASNGVENDLSHTRGTVSMARAMDPDSASSQFFIVHEDSTFLDGDYAAFGHVTEGMEVVDAICEAAEPLDDNGTIAEVEQPVITSMMVME